MAISGDEPRETTTDAMSEDTDWRHPAPRQGAEKVPSGLVWHNPGFVPQVRRPVPTSRPDEDLERHVDADSATAASGDQAPEQDPLDGPAGARPAGTVEPDDEILG